MKGTVLLVLRKQLGDVVAFMDEIWGDIRLEVARQIESMQALDNREDPNFSDPDYYLAAYAASLKVLTGYKSIGELDDFDYELNLAINDPSKSEVVKIIEQAKALAGDRLSPLGFDREIWKNLTPSERFYVKGVDSEKHGLHQISTYQEYARVFGLTDGYKQLLGSTKANEARLKSAAEMRDKSFAADLSDFDGGLLRRVLESIYVATANDDHPEKGHDHLKHLLGAEYWERREAAVKLLDFFADTVNIDSMDYWKASGTAAGYLKARVENDHV